MSRFISLFIIGIVLTTSLAFANPNYYANIGMSKPYAPENFQKNWRSGFNIGAGIGYNVKPTLEIQGELLYDNFQLDDYAFLGDIAEDDDPFASVMGGSVSILSLYVNAKFLSPLKTNDTITPYLIGGVGLVSKMTGEKEIMTELLEYIEPKESTTTAAAGLGIGVEIVMGARTSFVVEGRFNVLFTDETTVYFPLKLGIVIR